MHGIVTGQRARVGSLVVGDRGAGIRSHDVGVEADQPLARGIRNAIPDAVPRVAGGATESCIDVLGVFRKTRILQHTGEIVALPAQRIGTIHAEIWIGKQVGDWLPRRDRLA